MAKTNKRPKSKPKKKIPPPGRKLSKEEAREYVFKNYAEVFALLARH